MHHVRAVLAGQGKIGFELVVAVEGLDLLDDVLAGLGRMTANLEQGQDQGREFVAHGQTGEAQVDVLTGGQQGEGGTTLIAAVGAEADLIGQAGDILQQAVHFTGLRAIIEGRDDLDGARDAFEVGLELGFQICVQHGDVASVKNGTKKERAGKAPGRSG